MKEDIPTTIAAVSLRRYSPCSLTPRLGDAIEPLFKKVERKWQTFLSPCRARHLAPSDPDEVARKGRALQAYVSQGNFDNIAGVRRNLSSSP